MTAAVTRRRLKRGATGAGPVGMEVEACMSASLGGGAWRAGREVMHYLRKISSEMHRVVTNPISNSITGSLAGRPLASDLQAR